jgi:hypothetical protein
MIDHVGFSVSDYTRAKTFYESALAPLGYTGYGGHCRGDRATSCRLRQRRQAGFLDRRRRQAGKVCAQTLVRPSMRFTARRLLREVRTMAPPVCVRTTIPVTMLLSC